MTIAHVATATSKTANTQTNNSLAVTLGSTTAGDFNVIEITAKVDGSGINAGFTTPAGWTKLGEAFDSGTTSSTTTTPSAGRSSRRTSSIWFSLSSARWGGQWVHFVRCCNLQSPLRI
mgnify:CR=1 FL=1